MESNHSDIDIFMDMMDSKHIIHDERIELKQSPQYYSSKGVYIREQFDSTENYYHFLKEFIVKFNELNDKQKEIIKEIMGIVPKKKEENPNQKNFVSTKPHNKLKSKPRLNICDDY